MRVFVEGVGLLGPGLTGWQPSLPVLSGRGAYGAVPTQIRASDLLPVAERRRSPVTVKLALAVGEEAFKNAGRDVATVATVFTSSSGEGETLHQMCETLASADRDVSPTRFHNSVHNTASGYWGIATRSHEASTSICCYDESFVAGLIETVAQVAASGKPVALISYDQPYPEPLQSVRPLVASFAAALVLAPQAAQRTLAALDLTFIEGAVPATRMPDPGLERLRLGAPAARALPLLRVLACATPESVDMDFLASRRLRIAVSPC
jgi:hypothetical protein